MLRVDSWTRYLVEKVEQNQKDQKFDGHGAETLTPHHRGLP